MIRPLHIPSAIVIAAGSLGEGQYVLLLSGDSDESCQASSSWNPRGIEAGCVHRTGPVDCLSGSVPASWGEDLGQACAGCAIHALHASPSSAGNGRAWPTGTTRAAAAATRAATPAGPTGASVFRGSSKEAHGGTEGKPCVGDPWTFFSNRRE